MSDDMRYGVDVPIIKNIREPWSVPKCSATRLTKYYSDDKNTEYFCTLNATYTIGDKPLCKRHAAEWALGFLLEGKD